MFYRLTTDTSAKSLLQKLTNTHTSKHACTHTCAQTIHTYLVREPQTPPLLHDGLGLAPTVTVCDCDLHLTCWGYMVSWVIYIMHRERGGESHLRTREEGEELVSRGRKEEEKKKG